MLGEQLDAVDGKAEASAHFTKKIDIAERLLAEGEVVPHHDLGDM